jgi:hypothetical protein
MLALVVDRDCMSSSLLLFVRSFLTLNSQNDCLLIVYSSDYWYILNLIYSDLVYPFIQKTRSSSLKCAMFDQLDKSLEHLPLEHSNGPKKLAGGLSLALTCTLMNS